MWSRRQDGIRSMNYNEQLLKLTREFAVLAHGNQRYSGEPYVTHLDEVVGVLQEFGVTDVNILQSGYLHDVLEDTPVSFALLAMLFNQIIANTVERVTDKPKGASRKERHEQTYPDIAKFTYAIMVKLADRIANMRRGSKNDMYYAEYPRFRELLYVDVLGQNHPVISKQWAELDRLNALYRPV